MFSTALRIVSFFCEAIDILKNESIESPNEIQG